MSANELKLRRGTNDAHKSFVGAIGEVTVNTDENTLHVHDGKTPNGNKLITPNALNDAISKAIIELINGDNSWSGINSFYDLMLNKLQLTEYSTYKGKEIATILTPAGQVWLQSNLTTGTFSLVYYANGLWVTCGNPQGVYYSLDGINWILSNINSSVISSIYFGNGLWVAGGTDKALGLQYSYNGKTWVTSDLSGLIFSTVYYANGMWVVATTGSGLYYSFNGINWTQSNITSGRFYSIHHANGLWVAGGDGAYYSTDGINWTLGDSASNPWRAIYYANGIWVAGLGSDGGIKYSSNGKVWSTATLPVTNNGGFGSVYYGNGVWVATSYDTSANGLIYSRDGITWLRCFPPLYTWRAVYYANGLWVASSSSNGLWYSLDGITWIQSNISGDTSASSTIYHGNGIWCATTANKGVLYSISIVGQIYLSLIDEMLIDYSFTRKFLTEDDIEDLTSFRNDISNIIEQNTQDIQSEEISQHIKDIATTYNKYKYAKDELVRTSNIISQGYIRDFNDSEQTEFYTYQDNLRAFIRGDIADLPEPPKFINEFIERMI